jgi:serine/threonine protein kinase
VQFKVENLCGFLIRSKLMKPDEMLGMRERWNKEAKDPAQSTNFLKWLVSKNYVTEYQATLLARGLVDDFFLGHYKILERIGRGRMAGVYKAVHPSGQIVAIKVLPPSRAKNPQMLARFQREARLAVKLKHPHVVRTFQLGESRGVHYLVMEYLEGEPLDEVLLRRKRLTPAEAVRLIHQALLGLQHIHECGMVHRDLKPANLMITPTPVRGDSETTLHSKIRILDIGLARELFDENSPDPNPKNELTAEGVLLGTPDYLAPEQARDPRLIDIRADIYSLGCTLYHLITGQPPFPDKNILNQMIRHATETPKPLTEFVPNAPEGLSQIVEWMMAKQPAQRYPTPSRAAQAMEAFLMVSGSEGSKSEESPQMKKYLTWLETAASVGDEDATIPPPANIPVPNLKVPPSAVNKPTSPATPPAPVKGDTVKRKRRTGVKMPETPAASPVPPPAPPASPPLAAPVMAAPMPTGAAVPGAEQVDVELVDMPTTPSKKDSKLSKRDMIMIGAGIGAVALTCLVCSGGYYLVRMFTGSE